MGVVVDRERLVADLDRARETGRRIVLTNGVFDLLHIGHTRYLQQARALGDLLVVGLNSDASTHALKGPERPLVPEDERAELLAGLSVVDYVTVFSESTADALLEAVRPSIYVKGGDYAGGAGAEVIVSPAELQAVLAGDAARPSLDPGRADVLATVAARLPEAPTVARLGCALVLITYVPGHSTTALLDRIVSRYAPTQVKTAAASAPTSAPASRAGTPPHRQRTGSHGH